MKSARKACEDASVLLGHSYPGTQNLHGNFPCGGRESPLLILATSQDIECPTLDWPEKCDVDHISRSHLTLAGKRHEVTPVVSWKVLRSRMAGSCLRCGDRFHAAARVAWRPGETVCFRCYRRRK